MDGDKPGSSTSSGSDSSSSSSSDDEEASGPEPPSDEAASDPPTSPETAPQKAEGEQPALAQTAKPPESEPEPSKPARPAESQPLPKKPPKLPKKPKREREEVPEFELTMDTLQGRWRHSVSSLGMLTVRGTTVKFDMGTTYELEEIVPGRIEMRGWQTVAQQSCAEEIVWMNRERTREVRWMLEEDADQPPLLEGLDSRNIIQGKRKRAKVDYRAVAREIEAEERRRQEVFSDGSDGSQGEEAIETMTPKEWSAMHASQCAKATKLFHQWMLSTCTPRHDELLKRKGKLVTRLPVSLIGPGRILLQKGLASYGITLNFHAQETTVAVDATARQRYQARHVAEWQAAKAKLASKPPARDPQARPTLRLDAPAPEPSGQEDSKEPESGNTPRRKRLRRIVDSDEEAPVASEAKVPPQEEAAGPAETAAPPMAEPPEETAAPAEEMPASTADSTEVLPPPAEEPLEKTVVKVKGALEATPAPPAAKVLEMLTFLETQRVNPEIMLSTKIGATVTGLRKTYAGYPTLAQRAKDLVQRWKSEYERERALRV